MTDCKHKILSVKNGVLQLGHRFLRENRDLPHVAKNRAMLQAGIVKSAKLLFLSSAPGGFFNRPGF